MTQGVTDDLIHSLVIRSACAPSRDAVTAWSELHATYGWDHIPHALARFLPMIYLNTRGEVDVRDIDRLRGVYRASWAANLSRIAAIRPVLAELRTRGVEATVIKGGALCILSNQWGFRRMGDLDVVMPSSSARVVNEVLQNSKFVRITPGAAGLHSDVEGPWEGPNGAWIDVHFSDRWSRYAGSSARDTREQMSQGFRWTVPTPEAALAIALEHGQVGAGAGDLLQTTLDVHILSSMTDQGIASALLSALDLESTAVWHAMRLDAAVGATSPSWMAQLHVGTPRRRSATSPVRRQSLRTLFRRTREWRLRRLGHEDRRSLWQRRHAVSLSYWIWMESGMLGPLERLLSRAGTAPDPASNRSLPASKSHSLPAQLDVSVVPRRDLRTRLRIPTNPEPSRIRIVLPSGLEHRRFLFVGGRCMGLINPAAQPVIEVDLDDDLTGDIDVSLRLYWNVKPREEVQGVVRVDWMDR